jgi:hypothetical protein
MVIGFAGLPKSGCGDAYALAGGASQTTTSRQLKKTRIN